MNKKPKLRELIYLAKCGNKEAMKKVVKRFIPIINKYCHELRELRYEDTRSSLVTWIIEAVYRYQPNTTWGKDELARYLSSRKY